MVPSLMAKRWGNNGKSEKLYFLGSKITADGDCSHEIKRRLLFGRKVMINLHSILKNRDITLLTKICIVKDMVFPVGTYRCESWTIKKAEHWRIAVRGVAKSQTRLSHQTTTTSFPCVIEFTSMSLFFQVYCWVPSRDLEVDESHTLISEKEWEENVIFISQAGQICSWSRFLLDNNKKKVTVEKLHRTIKSALISYWRNIYRKLEKEVG